jgi:hypothetical protein
MLPLKLTDAWPYVVGLTLLQSEKFTVLYVGPIQIKWRRIFVLVKAVYSKTK